MRTVRSAARRSWRRALGRRGTGMLLATVLGACAGVEAQRDEACAPEGTSATVVPVVVHAVSRQHARVTARDIVRVANARLAGAGIELHVTSAQVHADLAATYTGQSLAAWEVPDAVDVFIFLAVEGATDVGPSEVQGRYLGDGTIVISARLGTWDTLAHEVGHMLGLQHVTDSANVMGPDRVWRTRFTAAQADTMRRRLGRLERAAAVDDAR